MDGRAPGRAGRQSSKRSEGARVESERPNGWQTEESSCRWYGWLEACKAQRNPGVANTAYGSTINTASALSGRTMERTMLRSPITTNPMTGG